MLSSCCFRSWIWGLFSLMLAYITKYKTFKTITPNSQTNLQKNRSGKPKTNWWHAVLLRSYGGPSPSFCWWKSTSRMCFTLTLRWHHTIWSIQICKRFYLACFIEWRIHYSSSTGQHSSVAAMTAYCQIHIHTFLCPFQHKRAACMKRVQLLIFSLLLRLFWLCAAVLLRFTIAAALASLSCGAYQILSPVTPPRHPQEIFNLLGINYQYQYDDDNELFTSLEGWKFVF